MPTGAKISLAVAWLLLAAALILCVMGWRMAGLPAYRSHFWTQASGRVEAVTEDPDRPEEREWAAAHGGILMGDDVIGTVVFADETGQVWRVRCHYYLSKVGNVGDRLQIRYPRGNPRKGMCEIELEDAPLVTGVALSLLALVFLVSGYTTWRRATEANSPDPTDR